MSLKNSEDDNCPGEQKGDSDQQVYAAVAELYTPAPDANPNKSQKRKKRWLECARFAVESLGLVGLIAYALLTWGIYQQSQRTVTEMQRQTRIDERPWLNVATFGDQPDVPSPDKILVDHPLRIPFEISNFGKTPARDVVAAFVIQITPNGQSPGIDGWKATHAFGQGVIYPGSSIKKNAQRTKVDSNGSGAIDLVSPEELKELRARNGPRYFLGRS